jgi:hypothetical protein
VFFKQNKQSLQLCDFLGNSASAVGWQVWTALLLYVLNAFYLRHEQLEPLFYRALHPAATTLWSKIDPWDLLRFCGIAGGQCRYLATPQSAYFTGFGSVILWDGIATRLRKSSYLNQ